MVKKYEELETEYAKYTGTKYAVSCNTGTAALHLALKAIGIKKGDEVIVPEFTMIACAYAVSYCQAKPVFVDCGDDLLIDVKKIEKKITTKTKAIMPVHIYGRVCNMDEIMKLARKYNLRVIEDCCEAQGATYKNKIVGSFDIGVFSFYKNKIVPAEEGGMITTNDKKVSERAKYLKNMAFSDKHDFLHKEIGFNYRMTEGQAHGALHNLKLVNSIQTHRFKLQGWYDKYINEKFKMPKRDVVWVYDIKHTLKNRVVQTLNKKGIKARHSFKPMSMQGPYKGKYKDLKAYKMSKVVCYLPVSPLMTENEVINICAIIDTIK